MNRLQALRTEKGINMKEAAQALSMPYTTYVNYEKGTREPSSEVLIKLAKFYDTSIDYLVGKVERVAPSPPGSSRCRSGTASRVWGRSPAAHPSSRRRMSRPTMKSPAIGMPILRCYARATAWSQKSKTVMS